MREGRQNTVKKLVVVVLTIKEMSYLVVGLFNDMVGLFCVNICDRSSLAALFALIHP